MRDCISFSIGCWLSASQRIGGRSASPFVGLYRGLVRQRIATSLLPTPLLLPGSCCYGPLLPLTYCSSLPPLLLAYRGRPLLKGRPYECSVKVRCSGFWRAARMTGRNEPALQMKRILTFYTQRYVKIKPRDPAAPTRFRHTTILLTYNPPRTSPSQTHIHTTHGPTTYPPKP